MRINKLKLEMAMANMSMSYLELSRVSTVTQTTLARLKRGVQNPRTETVGKIAKALEVNVSDIIEGVYEARKEG
ncbi:helix-turn-helix domain-containing protein [Pseudobacteroides cellulosolvens]|uniref:Helix-turn-helix domain protein n=1 Tax=Pseudobacteroides cellulosolvens ATCC 35603 = DSM 2933 TaxID=398512 RepID=A0A0L6JVU3_9FIRM|nr:helix-turn-helix transcriptional regulator [Pseudobacteroides cellulosolvens]KNY29839.1 helix-turn-helix domain protein [Pseudobacteroides cellulosolvens ATCC 35603 = DSM 2933]